MTKIFRDRLRGVAIALALAGVTMAPAFAAERTLRLYGDSLMAGLGLS